MQGKPQHTARTTYPSYCWQLLKVCGRGFLSGRVPIGFDVSAAAGALIFLATAGFRAAKADWLPATFVAIALFVLAHLLLAPYIHHVEPQNRPHWVWGIVGAVGFVFTLWVFGYGAWLVLRARSVGTISVSIAAPVPPSPMAGTASCLPRLSQDSTNGSQEPDIADDAFIAGDFHNGGVPVLRGMWHEFSPPARVVLDFFGIGAKSNPSITVATVTDQGPMQGAPIDIPLVALSSAREFWWGKAGTGIRIPAQSGRDGATTWPVCVRLVETVGSPFNPSTETQHVACATISVVNGLSIPFIVRPVTRPEWPASWESRH